METGARARGLAGWARAWRWCLEAPGRGGARCAILIGSSAFRNLRIRLKPHHMFFSNRSKIAYLRARFAQVSHTSNRRSRYTTRAFLIASRPGLETDAND
jgi:hypothetical protein